MKKEILEIMIVMLKFLNINKVVVESLIRFRS